MGEQTSDASTAMESTVADTATSVPTADAVVRSVYRHRFYTDSFRFVEPDEVQFLFVRVPEAASGVPPSEFELLADGERFTPDVPERRPPLMPRVKTLYTAEEPRGWLAFDLPLLSGENTFLAGPERRYRLPESAALDLAAYPGFAVESVLAPDRAPPDRAEIHVAIVVRNLSDRASVFLAGIGGGGVFNLMSAEIPGGDTIGVVGTWPVYDDAETLYFSVIYPGGGERYEIPVTSRETPTSTPTTNGSD